MRKLYSLFLVVITTFNLMAHFNIGAMMHSNSARPPKFTFNVCREKTSRYGLTYVFAHEDYKERSDKVINPLNISTGRVTYRPYKQYPFKNLQEN